jgi:hypothetical protein
VKTGRVGAIVSPPPPAHSARAGSVGLGKTRTTRQQSIRDNLNRRPRPVLA